LAAWDDEFVLVGLDDVIVAKRMGCLFPDYNVFRHFKTLARYPELILAWTHELACARNWQTIATRHPCEAVLPIVVVS
jgi:hypothetical protein